MNFCSSCGESVIIKIPEGDNRERHVCEHCLTIHYQNPRVIAGVLPVYNDQILLCRRAIEPRHGFWTLPAGFLENGESSLQGALRECEEEANAQVIEPDFIRAVRYSTDQSGLCFLSRANGQCYI